MSKAPERPDDNNDAAPIIEEGSNDVPEMGEGPSPEDVQRIADELAAGDLETARELIDQLPVDKMPLILVLSGPVDGSTVQPLVQQVVRQGRTGRPTILYASTLGGDPAMAYRLGRAIHRHCGGYTLVVAGLCKSAGTLLAVGAEELVFMPDGELGPLDIQMLKADEIASYDSSHHTNNIMKVLAEHAFTVFETFLLGIVSASQTSVSTLTASDIAVKATVGLMSPISAQIDPMWISKVERMSRIGLAYGERLNGGNLKPSALIRLVAAYPSHGFVVDFEEATTLFNRVRRATELEIRVAAQVGLIQSGFISGEEQDGHFDDGDHQDSGQEHGEDPNPKDDDAFQGEERGADSI